MVEARACNVMSSPVALTVTFALWAVAVGAVVGRPEVAAAGVSPLPPDEAQPLAGRVSAPQSSVITA